VARVRRGFAAAWSCRSRRLDDADEFAGPDVEVDAPERIDLRASECKRLAEITDANFYRGIGAAHAYRERSIE
jgi:hypothetical protein